MDSLGTYLKDLRERRGWTIRKAAAQLEVSPSRLAEIEKGESYRTLRATRPSRDLIQRIAQQYGVSEDSLLEMAEYKAAEPVGAFSPETRMVAEMFDQLNAERKQLAIAMLRVFSTTKPEP